MKQVGDVHRRGASGRRRVAVVFAVLVGAAVWLVGFGLPGGSTDTVPDTTPLFSLDLEVVAAVPDAPLVYMVEQRARPAYRILSFDPTTGAEETVFTVPEDAIIYGLDLSPDGSSLAVAYTTDYGLDGSGLWQVDVASGALSMISPVQEGIYLTDPEWTPDGSTVLATRVDRTGTDEVLDLVEVAVGDGAVAQLLDAAITPVVVGEEVYFLEVDSKTSARQAVGVLDRTTGKHTTVASGTLDLDHLVAGDSSAEIAVAVLDSDTGAGGLTLGSAASAHGNHLLPSSWWSVATASSLDLPSSTIYDAARSGRSLVYVTKEGLTVATEAGIEAEVIRSRALRFITA